ncbi:MAG: hypothetical protein WC601_05870 [Desulfotomaculaceae bacterium]
MKSFMLLLALIFLVGVYLIRRAVSGSSQRAGSGRIKLVITVKDQEPWVEGFVRKLFFRVYNKSGLDVVIVDGFSCDRTPDILERLARVYPFEFNTSGSCAQERDFAGALHFDVRGLSGKDLLDAPLFYRLSHLNEGKSQV